MLFIISSFDSPVKVIKSYKQEEKAFVVINFGGVEIMLKRTREQMSRKKGEDKKKNREAAQKEYRLYKRIVLNL